MEPPVGFNQRINQYENKRKGILNEPSCELKMNEVRIRERMKILEGI